jgi:hypothetical protein
MLRLSAGLPAAGRRYFIDAVRLYNHGLMTKRALKATASVDGIAIWFRIVERLERELKPDVDLAPFRLLKKLCGSADRGLIRVIE